MSDFFLEEVLELFNVHYIFKNTYFISGLSLFFWAFALAMRFNNEHNELVILKNRLEEKINERTLELQLSNEQKASIFFNLAHETRTPLTLIKNSLDDYFQKYDDNIEIDKIKYNVDKINQLIGNILNIEKSEKGHGIYKHDKLINISSFISTKIDYFSSYASRKNIKIINNIQKNLFLKIAPDALESLFDNLLVNAIKFTPKGSIMVTLSTKDSLIILSVKDTGVGIPEDIRNRIFEPYFHFSNKPNSGFGMGLTIVKNIVDSLKGNITFNSKPDKGTEFIVSFNNHQLSDTDTIYKDYEMNSSVIEHSEVIISDEISGEIKPFVLIIEDNADLLLYLKDKLKDSFNIYACSSCLSALLKINESPVKPDIIIADIMMEKMDGIQFLESLKKTEYSHIPLIYVTAKTSLDARDKAFSLGAIDFITKPFDISEVKQKVFSIINNSKEQRKAAINSVKNLLDLQSDKLLKTTDNQNISFDSNCELFNISTREKEIIKLAQRGNTYTEIANSLNISQKTVDTHFQNIFKKIGVNKQKELFDKLFI